MTWVIGVVVVIVALLTVAALAMLVGSRMPVSHVASRTAALAAPPAAVWKTITDVDAFASWRADVSRVERLPDRAGRTTWIEHGTNGRITYVVDRQEPPQVLVVRIADPALPFGGTWTYDVTPAAGGSTLRITEHGEIYNPLFRFMSRYVFGYEKTIAGYLTSLQKKLGGTPAS